MEAVFWLSVFLIAYPYVVYPALVWLLGAVRPRPVRRGEYEPSVTVLVPAYNEAESIGQTLAHLLGQDYPADKLQLVVISDGSDDGTDDIVRAHADRGVELLRREGRGGKALALNAGVRRARGDIIVFCDANARFAPDAVREMASNFADADVGYVTGHLTLVSTGQTVSGGGGSAYLRYESLVRTLETRVASVIGVNGGVDAIRRDLYSDVSRELITDFVLPLRVVAAGRRVVYDPRVRSTEDANAELRSEFRMRVRVALRALQGLMHMRRLLDPQRFPWASFALASHKLLRYMGFVFLVTAAVSNAWLAGEPGLYRDLAFVHGALYALALLGITGVAGGPLGRAASVPAYLLITYAAFAMATAKFLRGQSMATWQPRAG